MEPGGSKTMRCPFAARYRHIRKVRAFRPLPFLLTLLASLCVMGPQAQATEAKRDIFSELLPDNAVKTAINGMLTALPSAQCAPGQACAPASPEEIANPPVSLEQARGAMRAGFISGLAEWCGLDWQRLVFLPLTDSYRKVDRLEPRIVTMLTLLHGYGQGQMVESMKTQQCSAEQRDSIGSLASSLGHTR